MSDNDTPGRELATVTHLPARQVLDGEIVTEEQYRELTSQRGRALARREAYRRDVATVTRVTRTVVTHDRTKTAARAAMRHGLHVVTGLTEVAKYVRETRTNAPYQRAMRAAEAVNDWERWEKFEGLGRQAREQRHRHAMDRRKVPLEWLRALIAGGVALILVLLALGFLLFAGSGDAADVLGPIRAVIALVTFIAWVVTIVWGPLILALPWLVLLMLWHLGRKAGRTPQWCAPATAKRGGVPITPSVVVTAFRDLGIAPLRKAIVDMGDAGAGMLSMIRVAGCGVEVDVTLPSGTSTGEVLARREKLAQNLGRHTHEVFPTVAPSPARTVRVWAADPGALDEPIGTSPLVLDADLRADYRTGEAPWGQNLRGDRISISLFQRHLLITGQSNQGKSRAMIALALWLALDPTVELWIADLKGINDKTGVSDWEPFRDIAARFVAGPTDDHVAAATEMVEDAVVEMNRRLDQGGTWKPLVVIVDEAQKAYMCPRVGPDGRPYGGKKATSRFFMAAREMHNQGRVVDSLLWQGTQDPNDQNLPELVREGAHIRGCLAIGTAAKAAMALGEKAVEQGAAPHALRPGLDKGTLVVAGDGAPVETGQLSVTVRTYFVNHDDTVAVAERAKDLRGPARPVRVEEVRDLLDDVEEVLDGDDVRAPDVAVRLRRLAPRWPGYRHLTGTELVDRLKAEGAEVKMLDGYWVVRADRVRAALVRREAGQ